MQANQIKNIGWTLGNDCPYRCSHCYSSIVRNRGRNLEIADVDRIIHQLKSIGVETVNLGGNEPIFTGGLDPKNTVLPYIIRSLHEAGIAVGLTTAGISLVYLERLFPDSMTLLNDVDISLDSPFQEEHNRNRGASLYNVALKAMGICREYGIEFSIITCGMNWNLSDVHVDAFLDLAKSQHALFRINFMKPTEQKHMHLVPDAETFYRVTRRLLSKCKTVEMGEPLGSIVGKEASRGCPCGTTSFRIHSITPDGRVPVSPCVYAHDFKIGDLLRDELAYIIQSPQFQTFRKRRIEPESIGQCAGCNHLNECRGGCASRAYLWSRFDGEGTSLTDVKDPYCFRDFNGDKKHLPVHRTKEETILVHRDYLCTMIFDPSMSP